MKKQICLLLVVVLLFAGCSSKVKSLTWQEQYDLGVRYLSEGNYEEAILAFDAAIEIDPQKAEAYVKLAEIYIEQEAYDDAKMVLDRAIEVADFSEELEALWYKVTGNADDSELVVDAYSEEIGESEFHIPKINLDSSGVSNINDEIWAALYDGVVVDVIKSWEQGYDLYRDISYDWYVNNDIITLLIKSNDIESTNYYTYNVCISTGERVSDNELIAIAGMTQAEYADTVKQALGFTFFDGLESYIEQVGYDEFFRRQLENTISDENIRKCVPYFNESNQLCVIGAVYSVAGGSFYYQEINLEQKIGNSLYTEYMELQSDTENNADLAARYELMLLQHPETTPFTYGSNTIYMNTEYMLYDIDKDGTPELVVKEDGTQYYIYTYNGVEVVASDCNYWQYSDCMYAYDGNGIVIHDGGMGSLRLEQACLYVMEDSKLVYKECLKTTETCSFDDLYAFLDGLTPINDFRPITDKDYLEKQLKQ